MDGGRTMLVQSAALLEKSRKIPASPEFSTKISTVSVKNS